MILQNLQVCHCPSQCIPKRPRCCPPSRWLPSCLCFQSSYTCGAVLCQHRMWTSYLCLQCRMLPHLCLQLCLHYWEWPKPLEQINMKTLADIPVHLQRMLLWLQNYDVTIKYQPGKEMLVADALSHYAPLNASEICLDITINHVHITSDRITEFKALIQDDPLLHPLTETIIAG